jgi:hypothetical protein
MLRSLAVIVFLSCASGALAQAQERGGSALTPKQRERERKAMSAYAATRYQEALDLYADLYADFHDPLYLRNIGRCHQKLKRPEEAIASFEEYLSKYKRLSGAEIDEVKGWIAEMKELQKASAPPPPPPVVVPEPAPVPPPAPVITAPPPVVAPPPPVNVLQQVPPPVEDHGDRTIRGIGWGALIVGTALAATGGLFEWMAWSKFNSSKNGACLSSGEGCGKAADAIDQRATLSKIFFISGGALGLAGGAVILFYPVSEPSRPTSLSGMGASAGWAF